MWEVWWGLCSWVLKYNLCECSHTTLKVSLTTESAAYKKLSLSLSLPSLPPSPFVSPSPSLPFLPHHHTLISPFPHICREVHEYILCVHIVIFKTLDIFIYIIACIIGTCTCTRTNSLIPYHWQYCHNTGISYLR